MYSRILGVAALPTLFDIFAGAFPFAVIMLLVLILITAYPVLSLALL